MIITRNLIHRTRETLTVRVLALLIKIKAIFVYTWAQNCWTPYITDFAFLKNKGTNNIFELECIDAFTIITYFSNFEKLSIEHIIWNSKLTYLFPYLEG